MDKATLKKLLKPLMKECVREVLMEQGLNSIVSEVVQPAQTKQTVVSNQPQQKPQVNESRKKMLEEIGKSGYMNSRFDPFLNTKPLTESQAAEGVAGPMGSIDPSDPGIDISGFMNGNTNKWKALVGGKG